MKLKYFRNLTRFLRPICAFVLLAFTTSGWAQSEVAEVHAPVSDASAGDNFGWACSISGDTAVVGAKWDTHGGNSLAGSAYIYQRDQDCADCWGYVETLRPEGLLAFDFFGTSVSISGDIAVVGAPKHDAPLGDEGSVYIFYRNQDGPNNWGLKTILAEGSLSGQFGFSVFINRDLIIVGEPFWNGFIGQAHIFGRHEGGPDNWGIITAISASDGEGSDYFGFSVAINGSDFAIVGAPFDDIIAIAGNQDAGSAYIFRQDILSNPPWVQDQKLFDSFASNFELFGISVSISGETVIIGAENEDGAASNAGAAFIYEQAVPDWVLVKRLTASDAAASDSFGHSVSIDGDFAMVGAFHNDDNGSDSGSAYVFRRNEDGPDMWGQTVDPITASDAAAGDFFGHSVSLAGDIAIVGAYNTDDNGSNSGSSYVFVGVCPCPWDLDEDDVVSTADLLELFAQWGTDGPADFDGSGAVGTADLLILFANWGVCPCFEELPPPLSFEDELADACISEEDWDDYEDVMSDPLSPQSKKDRYQCWMVHYIKDCNRCTCLGPVSCPNPDPFK